MTTYTFPISGMTCASCVVRVEKIMSKFDGIQNVSVNLASEQVTFQADNSDKFNEIASAVEAYGYHLRIEKEKSSTKKNSTDIDPPKDDFYDILKKDFLLAIVLTTPVFLFSMLMDFTFFHHNWPFGEDYTNKILLIFITPVIFISGKRFYQIFWKNIQHLSFEMNSLIAIGTGAAYGYSALATLFPFEFGDGTKYPHVYFETAGVIITLILMGKLLEHRAKRKTNDAIKKLLELKPKTTKVLIGDKENEILVSELQIGHIVVIRPGEKIPADGIVISGRSTIDESMITGESIPTEKNIGEKVIGGTINKNGSFNFRVTELGDNSILGQIIRLVEQAQSTKPPIQKLVDKIAAVFVPIVLAIALITFVLWLFFGTENNFSNALINFVAVLIVACPCALGLATPTAIIVGTGKGALNGILIRDGESLESIQKVTTVVFDKTGTITEGRPQVSKIIANYGSENEILIYAASLESKSEHPLARAVVDEAQRRMLPTYEPESFQNMSGFGITGIVNNRAILVGNEKFLKEYSISLNSEEVQFKNPVSIGTSIYIAIDGKVHGLLIVEDQLKRSSSDAINLLKKMKIKTVMLTGDNLNTAKSIAEMVNIDQFQADVLPEEKLKYIKKYQSQNEIVAMVGDGINDAPALAQADVSIAIGTGTDVAIETAQITLVHGDLSKVAKAINLSKQTLRTIKQNLFWAFFYNVILIPLAAMGMLNPMIAALAMSLSSVSVLQILSD
jgi:P-type Cu+ transporter